MAYLGPPPSQKIATPTSQYFSGNGSATAFTLNRPVNVAEDLNVFVNNVAQQPGSGKSYTATGTTLTFDAAPDAGTNNVYVVYRGLSEGTLRLEHPSGQPIAATTGTFSSSVNVGTIKDAGNNATALTIDSAGNVTGNAGLAGTATTGQVLLASEQWTTDTLTIDMMVIDSSKYQTYKLYWWITHTNSGGTSGTSDSWYSTALTFLTAANTEVTSYDNAMSWKPTTAGSTPTHNSATYAAAQGSIWMAGNGQSYDSSGEGIIFVPNNSAYRAGIRGNSMLIGTPRASASSGLSYLEHYAGVALAQDPTAITGVRIRSFYGATGRPSNRGTVHLYGLTG